MWPPPIPANATPLIFAAIANADNNQFLIPNGNLRSPADDSGDAFSEYFFPNDAIYRRVFWQASDSDVDAQMRISVNGVDRPDIAMGAAPTGSVILTPPIEVLRGDSLFIRILAASNTNACMVTLLP
jgi:hypothetical protein